MALFSRVGFLFVTIFIAVIVASLHTKNEFGIGNSHETLDIIILALYKDIKFMFERPEQMNIDAIFGLNFAQAHAISALRHENSIYLSETNRRFLEDSSRLCERIRTSSKLILSSSGFEGMIRPEIWNGTISWKRGDLGRPPRSPQGLDAARAAAALIHQGTPAETESSRCLSELLDRNKNLGCKVSEECAEMLVREDSSRGYPLTHRLLYVQTATALNCVEHPRTPFEKLRNDYCAAILQDLVDVESANFPPPSADLAMEQILLCGMEGHLEFANSHYANLIASWPNSHGCYSAFGFENEDSKRGKRSTALMDHGCDNHASGVAAASLSLLIRAAVENIVN